MPRRGPYKKYEVDGSVPVPRQTVHNRRKRFIQDQNEQDHADEWHEDVHQMQHNNQEDTDQIIFEQLNDDEHDNQGDTDQIIFEQPNDDEHDNQGDIDQIIEQLNDDQIDLMNVDDDDDNEEEEELLNECFQQQDRCDDEEEALLYPGSSVTKTQSLLLLLRFLLRHNLTDEALSHLLMLFNTFFPGTVPASKHKFYKSFITKENEVHFYCCSCKCYLGKDETARNCESCQKEFCAAENKKNGNFFIYIPIEHQVKDLLSDRKLHDYLTNRKIDSLINAENLTDVTTSRLYKELITKHAFSGNDISLTWNTDGVPVFKSSKYSVWPLQASINELPPHLRAKNMLLVGLWFGEKPHMNTFLKPFVSECSKLQSDGFLLPNEAKPRKVFPLLFCGDAPARAIVRNAKQFNGEFGCDWCESPGETVRNGNGPPIRYYPYREPVTKRTGRKQAQYALQASQNGQPVKGVKGVAVIDLLPTFDTVRGVTADYMHSVCLGVTRKMVDLWVDSKHHQEEFYIGRQVDLVNNRLNTIAPPSEIHRAPRSLSERRFWKASEWRAFLLYSLVILQGILPARYLKHFFLYVYGIYMLLGDSITNASIVSAEAALKKFVIQLEQLYGLRHCSFNVHCLIHLSHCVRDCGPLWATSAFIYESHNHCLLKMFNGTQYIPQQITDTFLLKKASASMERNCIDDNSCSTVTKLLEKLEGNTATRFAHGNSAGALGKAEEVDITASTTIAIQNLLKEDIANRSGLLYQRFVHNHQLYSSKHYTRAKTHSNCTIMFQTDCVCYGTVLGFLQIKPHCHCEVNAVQYCHCEQYSLVLVEQFNVRNQTLFKDTELNVTSSFLFEVLDRESTVALFPHQVLQKCILIHLDNRKFVCPLPYRIYGD